MLFHRTTVQLGALLLCLSLAGGAVSADGGAAPAFAGICVTEVPEAGAVHLGNRVIHPGDVLTAEQTALLTYSHPETEEDIRAVLEYLPIGSDGVGAEAEMVFWTSSSGCKIPYMPLRILMKQRQSRHSTISSLTEKSPPSINSWLPWDSTRGIISPTEYPAIRS